MARGKTALDTLGHGTIYDHLLKMQSRQNHFVHGDPEVIDDGWVRETTSVGKACKQYGSSHMVYVAPAIRPHHACTRTNGTANSWVKMRDRRHRRACHCRDTSRRGHSVSKSGYGSRHAAKPRARRSAFRANRWRHARKDGGQWPATGRFFRHNRMGKGSRPILESRPSTQQQNRIPKVPFLRGWFPMRAQETAVW